MKKTSVWFSKFSTNGKTNKWVSVETSKICSECEFVLFLNKIPLSDRKEEKDKFYTTKGIRREVSRTRYSKGISRRWNMVDTSQFPKLSRRSCRENTKQGREQKEGVAPTGLGERRQHVWEFLVNCGTKSNSWQCFSVRVAERPARHMFTLWQKPAKNITKFNKLVYLLNSVGKNTEVTVLRNVESLAWEKLLQSISCLILIFLLS